MELKKRKYKRKEVGDIINAFEKVHQQRVSEHRNKIAELIEENRRLIDENLVYKNNSSLIVSTLERAEKSAKDTTDNIAMHYDLELERLRKFSMRWDRYFKSLRSQYPLYPTIQNSTSLVDKLNNSIGDSKDIIEQLDKSLSDIEGQMIDPREKIKDYIAATSDSEFKIEDVLNPGKLELEDLCKELGLMDEE